jgi:regulator of replication initiation timing
MHISGDAGTGDLVLRKAVQDDSSSLVDCLELEVANTLLRAELEAAHSKLAEVEHHEWTLTSENKDLKKDLEDARSACEAAVRDKELVRQTKQSKLQRFQDSVHKRLAKL